MANGLQGYNPRIDAASTSGITSSFNVESNMDIAMNYGKGPAPVKADIGPKGTVDMSDVTAKNNQAQAGAQAKEAVAAGMGVIGLLGIQSAYKQAKKAADDTYSHNVFAIGSNRNEYEDKYGMQQNQLDINETQTRSNLALALQQNNIQTNNAKMASSQQQLQQRTAMANKLVGAKSLSLQNAMNAQGGMSTMDHADELTNALNSSNAAMSKSALNVKSVQAKNANANARANLAYQNSVQEGKFDSQISEQAVQRAKDKLGAERAKWNQMTQVVESTAQAAAQAAMAGA